MQRLTTVILLLGVIIPSLHSAPSGLKENLLNIRIEEVPDSFISAANKQVDGLKDTLTGKVMKVTGAYNAFGDAVNNKVKVVSGVIAPVVDTVGKQVTLVNDKITQGAAMVGGQIANQFGAAQKALNDAITAGNGYVMQGKSLAQNALGGKVQATTDLVGAGTSYAQMAFNDKLQAANGLIVSGTTYAQMALGGKIQAANDLISQGSSLAENTVTNLGRTVTDLMNMKVDAVSNVAAQARGFLPKENPFEARPRKIDMAILEQEDPLSKAYSVKDNLQHFVAGIFRPEPVVDNITDEREKYGNTGDRFAPIGKALVGTTEGLASFLSNLVNVPFKVVQSISKTATDKFNNLGGRLIGL